MAEIQITKDNFEENVKNAEKPVLLDFWATWCGPCRMLAPILSQIAEEYGDRITVGKVNVDEQEELAAAFRIESIPTLLLIQNGKAVTRSVGYRPKSDIEELLRQVL